LLFFSFSFFFFFLRDVPAMAAATSPAGTHLETHSKVLMGLWKEKGGWGKQKKKILSWEEYEFQE
jgi:hypothetical protein